jgi:hypothetical protein
MEYEQIQEQVLKTIKKVLPETFNIMVQKRKSCFGNDYLGIGVSPSFHEINKVKQFPQYVSFSLDLVTLELEERHYAFMGGTSFHRKPRPDLFPKEKYLALGRVKVPFRKPKRDLKSVLSALQRFFERYLNLLHEWGDDLKYKEYGDYSFLNVEGK